MLKLRRGIVASESPLLVIVEGERRPAWVDEGLLGPAMPGDEVVVNVEARDLALGSGGFDIVCVNLTRGLDHPGAADEHVMKLNYSPLQHPVEPIERGIDEPPGTGDMPVLVIPLHGHLAPATHAFASVCPDATVGFVQGPGGALPGALSRDVTVLRERGLLRGHVTAGQCYGGELEAVSLTGALDAVAEGLGWDAAVVGPGPGILGSGTRMGHGGMATLDAAHAALSLGLTTLVSPRLSEADPRGRHRGLSHHTASVLDLLLAPVEVPIPSQRPELVDGARGKGHVSHTVTSWEADLAGYAESGLPRTTMGRDIAEDGLFFAAPLAAGAALASRLPR